ncbi:MAG: DNA primase [Candidatus Borkfalkiaceae bacterium]|nr:DNA primase [Christensenellaceae bacterium]
MRFDERFIEELKEKVNIVDIVGGYCQLTKKGSSYWACCPLPGHSERTPSFSVNETGQFYKCFGCGKGGDVIKFVMEIENLDFYDAVKLLCEKAKIPLPEEGEEQKNAEFSKKKFDDKQRLFTLMRETAMFYVENLSLPEAEKHRAYLKKRNIDRSVCRAFGIGASLGYDGLVCRLKSKGFTEDEMLTAGVCQKSRKTGRIFDAEANRLIFPVIDSFGKVVAFGGRALEVVNGFAKYKNTSETVLFNKRKVLYNINLLKKARQEQGSLPYVIMVEGYMDTIALYKAGYKNVVASMGTSLTVEQARLVKRYSDTVLICYDGDGAGQKATVRGLEILRDNGLEVRVVSLPDGLDPDEIINRRGKAAYDKCLNDALPLVDFKLKLIKNEADFTNVGGRRDYINKSLKVIGECEDAFLREELLKRLRDESGITYESLKRDLERGSVSSDFAGQETVTPDEKQEKSLSMRDKAQAETERFVLCSFIRGESYTFNDKPSDFLYTDKFRGDLSDLIEANKALGKKTDPKKLQEFAGEENLGELEKVLSCCDKVDASAREKYYSDCAKSLKIEKLLDKQKRLNALFTGEKQTEKREEIAKQLTALAIEISELKKRR